MTQSNSESHLLVFVVSYFQNKRQHIKIVILSCLYNKSFKTFILIHIFHEAMWMHTLIPLTCSSGLETAKENKDRQTRNFIFKCKLKGIYIYFFTMRMLSKTYFALEILTFMISKCLTRNQCGNQQVALCRSLVGQTLQVPKTETRILTQEK